MPTPKPHSPAARNALLIIGEHWGASPRPMFPETREAYELWGKITGTHIRPGHRNGLAAKAEAFAAQSPPPPDQPLSLQFDHFHVAKTGKSWRVPFVRYQNPDFTIDWTLIHSSPHWRIRFPGRGRAAFSKKIALLTHLQSLTLPTAPKGRLTYWFVCPEPFLTKAPPYVRKFLKGIAPD